MSQFHLSERIPSCFVSKDLVLSLERYLTEEMKERAGDTLGDAGKWTLQVAITEKLGTETLTSIRQFAPSLFSDATESISISWSNGYGSPTRLSVDIRFDPREYISDLKIRCDGTAARETATGIRDGVFRIIAPHKTYNWLFSGPTASYSRIVLFVLLLFMTAPLASAIMKKELGPPYNIAIGSLYPVAIWYVMSGFYSHAYVTFDSRRQRTMSGIWKWLSLGILGFVVFGTLIPAVRKKLLGF